jgi:hypothetical protein
MWVVPIVGGRGVVMDETLRLLDGLAPEVVMRALLEARDTGAALEALRVIADAVAGVAVESASAHGCGISAA